MDPQTPSTTGTHSALTVLTLNVWFGPPGEPEERATQRFLAQLDLFSTTGADVICLQEATQLYLTVLTRAQASSHPFLSAYTINAPTFSRACYGVCMLVRTALLPAFSRHPFESRMGRELLLARIGSAAMGHVRIGCVHLESLDNPEVREAQLAQCLCIFNAEAAEAAGAAAPAGGEASRSSRPQPPALLCGDFNFCRHWDFDEMKKSQSKKRGAVDLGTPPPFCFSPLAPLGWVGPALDAPGASAAAAAAAAPPLASAASPLASAASPLASAASPMAQLTLPAGGRSSRRPLFAPSSPQGGSSATENAAMLETMQGFVDAWPALHGPSLPGFTFDSLRNGMLEGYEQMAYDRILARLPAERFQLTRCEVLGTEPLPPAPAPGAGGGGGGGGTPVRRGKPLWMSDHFAVLAVYQPVCA